MGGRGVLSRVTGAGGAAVDTVESIVAHLRAVLNTRRGDSATVPDFGVLDFADVVHDFPAGVQRLARSIRATVAQYEPRLRNVNVRHVVDEDALTLHFEITGQLADARSTRTLRLATTVRAGGRVEVTR
jgi:type VI secretion system protein